MDSILLMQALQGGSGQTGQGGSLQMILPLVLLMGVMYFVMYRPQKKRQKEEQERRASIEIGDEIITIGGICGRIVTIREEDLIIETGSDRNKMKIQRWAIQTNVTKDEQHKKEVEAAREAAKAKKAEKKSKKEVIDETKDSKKD